LLNPAQRETTEILALAIDDRNQLQMMVDRIARETNGRKPEFIFLSDPGHRVIDRYGLLNPSGRGWPHPTTYVIDRGGVVRWKFTEVNYKIRPTNAMILEALAAIH
jgi:peroxiredoxin